MSDKLCPHCEKGTLQLVKGTYPHSEDYFICNYCDSTYPLKEKKHD